MNTKESEITGHRDTKSRIVGIRNTDRLLSKDQALKTAIEKLMLSRQYTEQNEFVIEFAP